MFLKGCRVLSCYTYAWTNYLSSEEVLISFCARQKGDFSLYSHYSILKSKNYEDKTSSEEIRFGSTKTLLILIHIGIHWCPFYWLVSWSKVGGQVVERLIVEFQVEIE